MDVDGPLTRAGADGIASSRQLQAAGLSRSQLSRAVRAGRLVRLLPRVYGREPLPAWPVVLVREGLVARELVLRVRAVLLSLGPHACAAGRTAAALRGWGMLHEPLGHVEVVVPHGRGRSRAHRAHVRQLRRLVAEEVVALPGLPPVRVLDPLHTVLDCCLGLPLLDAVVVVDSALRARAVTLARLRAALPLRPRSRRRVARVLELCDPEAGSVLESVLRVHLQLAGLSGWVTQHVVRDAAGRHVLRSDFCWPAAGLVVEADGHRWHQDRERDRRTDNALAACGWRVLRFTWAEVVHDPDRVLAQVRAALRATDSIRLAARRAA